MNKNGIIVVKPLAGKFKNDTKQICNPYIIFTCGNQQFTTQPHH